MRISACLITLNEEANLRRCLESVRPLVEEILVVDSGSSDATLAIAAEFGARCQHHDWAGYVGQKNFALEQAEHDWVLSIDADEEISPALAEGIRLVKEIEDPARLPAGYEVSRLVHYQGQWIYHGDWFPDVLVRLFRLDRARFAGGRVHERLEVDGSVERLPGYLHHFTYRDRADRAARTEKYARLWAESAAEAGKTAGPLAPASHALARFLKGYLLKRGFLDGALGFEIAAGNAREVWLKYRELRGLQSGPD
ncbi:MAG: glycosyltransferase family 2 protein [Verrucomicrobiota bacterium]